MGRAGGREVIVSAGSDAVRVWDAASGEPVGAPLAGHTSSIHAVAVGRAGGREVIVSGEYDGTVRVWDAATGEPVGGPLTGQAAETRRCGSGTRPPGNRSPRHWPTTPTG